MRAGFLHRRGPTICLAAVSVLVWISSSRAGVTVAQFRDDRAGAMSFTFDDASQSQYDLGIPYLDARGLRASFYVIADFTRDTQAEPLDPRIPDGKTFGGVSWDQWAAALAAGHEIGNHTMTHPRLSELSVEEFEAEVLGAKQLIKQKLGVAPLTFVFPFHDGRTDPALRSFVLDHHIAVRMTEYTYGSTGRATLTAVNWVADDAVTGMKWNVPMIHGIDEEYSPLDRAVFYGHINYCKGLVDAGDLWVETFANVSRYTQERAAVTINVQPSSPPRVVFTATLGASGLDPAVFDYPLTFMVDTTPDTAASATAIREGSAEEMPLTIETNRILVDAAPAAGAITVAWTTDAANYPPVVDAGGDRSVVAEGTLDFSGFVADGTVPVALVSRWEFVSGPEAVVFDPADSKTASATFGAAGEYVIRLFADDGELVASDAITVTVLPQAVTVTAPTGGQFKGKQDVTITWTGTLPGNVKIEFSDNGWGTSITVIGSTANSGSYIWELRNVTSADCAFRVSDASDGDPSDVSGTFSIAEITDDDNDSMDDDWELLYWENIGESDGTGDPDGDGLTDLEEFWLGRDPTVKEQSGTRDSGSCVPAGGPGGAATALTLAAMILGACRRPRRRDLL